MRSFSMVLESSDAPSSVCIVLETSKQIWWVLESTQKIATIGQPLVEHCSDTSANKLHT